LLDVHLLRSQKDPVIRRMFALGVVLYASAFLLWNLDNLTCHSLGWLRSTLPPVLRPLTQLHAWWHIFAGYASYIHILICLKARNNIRGTKSQAQLGLVGFTISRLPSHHGEANGTSNGATNGATNGHVRNGSTHQD